MQRLQAKLRLTICPATDPAGSRMFHFGGVCAASADPIVIVAEWKIARIAGVAPTYVSSCSFPAFPSSRDWTTSPHSGFDSRVFASGPYVVSTDGATIVGIGMPLAALSETSTFPLSSLDALPQCATANLTQLQPNPKASGIFGSGVSAADATNDVTMSPALLHMGVRTDGSGGYLSAHSLLSGDLLWARNVTLGARESSLGALATFGNRIVVLGTQPYADRFYESELAHGWANSTAMTFELATRDVAPFTIYGAMHLIWTAKTGTDRKWPLYTASMSRGWLSNYPVSQSASDATVVVVTSYNGTGTSPGPSTASSFNLPSCPLPPPAYCAYPSFAHGRPLVPTTTIWTILNHSPLDPSLS